jgi:hypothetical protein
VTEAEEKVKQIRANLLTAQSRQQSYTDERCHPLEFEVGDHVYFWVSSMKGVRRFGNKGKLAPRYIGPYPILEKFGPLAYQVELPSKLLGINNVFHVSQLKRCLKPPTDVVVDDTIQLEPDLTYEAYPVKILEQQDRVTQKKTTRFSGTIIRKTKKLGNVGTIYNLIIRSFYPQGKSERLPRNSFFPY